MGGQLPSLKKRFEMRHRSMPKFKTREEYTRWCISVVDEIYYSSIAGNNDKVREIIHIIQETLHVSEGEDLYETDFSNSINKGTND
jgi:hypothetical protein